MTNNCKDCFWYAFNTLLLRCYYKDNLEYNHWFNVYEGRDCPKYENKVEKYNEMLNYMSKK